MTALRVVFVVQTSVCSTKQPTGCEEPSGFFTTGFSQVAQNKQVKKMDNPISENIYSEAPGTCQEYHPTRNRGRCCLPCQHWTGLRELRQEKRHILVISEGQCRLKQAGCLPTFQELQEDPHLCEHKCLKFEKISELRAKNMTVRQRLYANMYSKTFLTNALRWHYNDPSAQYNNKKPWNQYPDKIIAKYINRKKIGN